MGWKPADLRTSRGAHPEHARRHARRRMEHRSRSAITRDIGKSDCSCRRPPRTNCVTSGAIPFAGFCTDPCDGRTQGTTGMMDSLPYRNDAAIVLRTAHSIAADSPGGDRSRDVRQGSSGNAHGAGRQPRSPRRRGPGWRDAPGDRRRRRWSRADDRRALRARSADARGSGRARMPRLRLTRRRMSVPGTAATSQVVAEALGLTVPHAALAPSGQPIWLDVARRSARAALRQSSSAGSTGSRH